MFAWLVRDCITQSGDKMEETPRASLKQLEGGALKVIRVHIKKEQLMNLAPRSLWEKQSLPAIYDAVFWDRLPGWGAHRAP